MQRLNSLLRVGVKRAGDDALNDPLGRCLKIQHAPANVGVFFASEKTAVKKHPLGVGRRVGE